MEKIENNEKENAREKVKCGTAKLNSNSINGE